MSNARDAAIRHIKRDVDRGMSLQSIKDSCHMASSPGGSCVAIGGFNPHTGRANTPDQIMVTRDIEGRECFEIFKLKEIYQAAKTGQATLF